MENIETTPDLNFRYQIELGDINEILRKDMTVLNTLTQVSSKLIEIRHGPVLVFYK